MKFRKLLIVMFSIFALVGCGNKDYNPPTIEGVSTSDEQIDEQIDEQKDDKIDELKDESNVDAVTQPNASVNEVIHRADYQQYPFIKIKADEAKIDNSEQAQKWKQIIADKLNNLTKIVLKEQKVKPEEHQQPNNASEEIMLAVADALNLTDFDSPGASFIEMIKDDESHPVVKPDDIIIFSNDDRSFKTNRPIIVDVRCSCDNLAKVHLRLQGLLVIDEGHEGIRVFATPPVN